MERLSVEECRWLAEQGPAMIWRARRDGWREYFNATWLAFTGRALKEELGHGWRGGIHPEDRDGFLAHYAAGLERGVAFSTEYRLRRHDGAYRRIAVRAVPRLSADGAFAGLAGSCLDVHDRAPAETAADDAAFFEMSLDHLCVAGFDGYWKRLNPSWTRTLGWTPEEMTSRPLVDFAHPDDREAILAARARLRDGVPLRTMANRYRCKDGTYRWLEWRSVANVDRGVVYAIARDVTAEKEAERTLRELNQSLTTILDGLAEGVVAVDRDDRVTRTNPIAESLTGWSGGDAQGKPLREVLRVQASDGTDGTLLEAQDGTRRPISISRTPMRDVDGKATGAVIVLRDLTAERQARQAEERLQRQLMLADRMASVGTLAAGVAHEINNPLAYVTANLEMILEDLQKTSDAVPGGGIAACLSMALEAQQGAERIRRIVRGLMTFSRAQEERRTHVDLVPVLELSVNMAQNEIRHRARLVKDYGVVPPVEADETRLGQVFVNLLVNAAQAIPEGDTEGNEIRISTSTDAAGRAVVEIRDTGPGIPPGAMDRIFDPFFTTKPIGVGTGLGLAICHSIVGALGGQISAANRPGRGASFQVVLPAAPSVAREERAEIPPAGSPAPRRATVLIVDDDRAVATTLGRLLRAHEVTVVTSAKDALERVLAGGAFDLILSDLMMPEMSGMDLYDELSRRRPEAARRMVFMTGCAFTPIARAFLDRVPNERMEKPIDTATLRALVERFAR